MKQSRSPSSHSVSKPSRQGQAPVQASDSHDDARLMNMLARAASAEREAGELAYGCVDWYLYGPEALSPVSH
jgi:hypothetical protein